MAETESVGKKIWIGTATGVLVILITSSLIPWLRENVLLPFVRALCRWGAAIGNHLTSSATIPLWLLWILIGLSGIVLLRIASFILHSKGNAAIQPSAQRLNWHSFTELVYEGIRWVWQYDSSGRVTEIAPLCPICAYQLDLRHDARPYDLQAITIFWCDHCKKVKGQLDGEYEGIRIRVHKEINRLYQTGEWENIVRRQMAARK